MCRVKSHGQAIAGKRQVLAQLHWRLAEDSVKIREVVERSNLEHCLESGKGTSQTTHFFGIFADIFRMAVHP